jgi:hypothetical protein
LRTVSGKNGAHLVTVFKQAIQEAILFLGWDFPVDAIEMFLTWFPDLIKSKYLPGQYRGDTERYS